MSSLAGGSSICLEIKKSLFYIPLFKREEKKENKTREHSAYLSISFAAKININNSVKLLTFIKDYRKNKTDEIEDEII